MRAISRTCLLLALLAMFAAPPAFSAPPRYSAPTEPRLFVTSDGYAFLNRSEDWRGPGRRPAPGQQDTLRTGWGLAEVYLGTGSGLWLGPNSLVWMTLVDPREVKFELLRGTAVLEFSKLDSRQKATLSYKGSNVSVLDAGLYRVDVEGAGLMVFKGKALVSAGLHRIEVNAGEMTLVDRAQTKSALGPDAEATLSRWRQWREEHGEPNLDVLVPFRGRSMGGGGAGRASAGMARGARGRSSFRGRSFTPGGQTVVGFGSGLLEIALSGGGPVYINELLVTPEEAPESRISDRDLIRTTGNRVEMSIGSSSSLWAGENTSIRAISARPSTARFELVEGAAVLEQNAGPFPASLIIRNATIQTLGPGVFRLDGSPPALRVFEGSAEVQIGGRKVKVSKGKMLNLDGSPAVANFNRGKTDSFGRWPLWRPPVRPSTRDFPTDDWPTIGPPPL